MTERLRHRERAVRTSISLQSRTRVNIRRYDRPTMADSRASPARGLNVPHRGR